MRQLLPSYDEDVDLLAAYRYPDDRPWVRANMVASLDGSAVRDGRSEALSGPADQQVFGVLRGLADVVLVGAGTARAEGYRALRAKPTYAELRASLGQRPAPVLALVSGRLDLDPASALFHGGGERTVVVTSADADPAARARLAEVADVVVAGATDVDLAAALDELAGRGLTRVLCEGGPTLLAALVAAGRLDELCLTFVAAAGRRRRPRIVAGPRARRRVSRWVTCSRTTACCSPLRRRLTSRDRHRPHHERHLQRQPGVGQCPVALRPVAGVQRHLHVAGEDRDEQRCGRPAGNPAGARHRQPGRAGQLGKPAGIDEREGRRAAAAGRCRRRSSARRSAGCR